jgi:FKBP-type peptidyl-prolyl cis-trans isomerase
MIDISIARLIMKATAYFTLTFFILLLIGFRIFSKMNTTTANEHQTAGLAFLADNSNKDNIITTASGLQYEILTKGTGSSPTSTDQVTVHYQGTTLEGKEFDSSYQRGTPATFPLNGVIAGWTEGLQLMQEGAKYRFFIPSTLAYGERGAGADIPANATLIFEVELIKVL